MLCAGSSLAWLELYVKASDIASSAQPLEAKIHQLAGIAAAGTGADMCLVLVVEQQTGRLVPRGSWPVRSEPQCATGLLPADSAAASSLTEPATLAIPSRAHLDPRFRQLAPLHDKDYEAVLSAPLTDEDRVIGRLNVYHCVPRVHTPEEVGFVAFLAQQLGAALAREALRQENRLLRQQVELLCDQLETRKLVERAKGILQQRMGLTEEDAYFRLRNESRRQRRPMKELAREIIEEEMRTQEARSPERETNTGS